MPPGLTGTLLDDAHDLDVLANVTAGNMPFEAFYVAGIDVGIPSSFIEPANPEDWIRGTRWPFIHGRRWPSVQGTQWDAVRGLTWGPVRGPWWPTVNK